MPLRSRHRPKSTEKDLALPISVGESVIIHSGLNSALTSPRLYDQYTLHTALAGYVDPNGLSPRLKSAFLGVCRSRENRTLATVFEEMRLETVVSRLSRRYYQSHLKHRLFKVLKLNSLLPKALAHVSTALLAKHWRKYREKVGLLRVFEYKGNRLAKLVLRAWKQRHFYLSIERVGKQKYMQKFFNCWLMGFRYERLEVKRNQAIAAKILKEWTQFSHKIAILRAYFQALSKFSRTHKAFRVSNSIRLSAFRRQLQGKIRSRLFHSLIEILRKEIKTRFNSYVQSSVKLHDYKLEAARRVLVAWNCYVKRPAPLSIGKKKVFRAMRVVLERKKARIRATAKVGFGVKSRFFREWLGLLLSGVCVQIRAADSTRTQHQLNSVFQTWVSLWTERRYRQELASKHQATGLLRQVLEGWKAIRASNKSIRQEKAYVHKRKRICFSAWRQFWEDSSMFHYSVFEHFRGKRLKHLLYLWRKGTILSQIQDEKLSGSFQIASCLQSAFDELKEGIYRKRLVQLHRKRVKRLLEAWRGVIKSINFYRNQAYSASFSSKYVEESMSDDSFAIAKATKLVTSRLKETKKQVRIRRLQGKVAKETKTWAWKWLEIAIRTSRRGKSCLFRGEKLCLKHVVDVWKTTWEKGRKCREMERKAKGKIGEIRGKQGLTQLRRNAVQRISRKHKCELALSHFFTKKAASALKSLFQLSQQHKYRRDIALKIQLSTHTKLISKALKAFKLYRHAYFLRQSVSQALSKSCKFRCFSAFKLHHKCKQTCKLIAQKSSRGSLQTILSSWKNLSKAKTALRQEDYAAALGAGNGGKAWKWVQEAVLGKRRKARGLHSLRKYCRNRLLCAQKQRNVQEIRRRKTAVLSFKNWRIYWLSQTYRRKTVFQRLKYAFKALFLHRFQGRLQTSRSKRTIRMLFWAWRGKSRQTSTHHYIGFSGDQSLCKRPQLMQIFSVWSRKTHWKKRLPAWTASKKALFVRKIWLTMKETQRKSAFERDQIFHFHKNLLSEMKQNFRTSRLAGLFRSRKLGLKSFQALKLETFAAQITQRSEDQSVFLYLPKEEAAKVQELLANESSLIDQHQIDLENELSLLTFELQRSPEKPLGRRAPPSALVHSSVMSGVSPEKAGRKLMETEREVLNTYVQYRHSMRSLDRASQSPARIFTPSGGSIGGQRENCRKAQGKAGSKRRYKWADSGLGDALKIGDLEDFSLPE